MTTPKTVLVTGGASGIGLAIVNAVLAQGWRAVVADVNTPGDPVDGVHFLQLDVTNEDAVASAIAKCDTEVGPLTGLVNCAGIGWATRSSITTNAANNAIAAASRPRITPELQPSSLPRSNARNLATIPRHLRFRM